MGLIAVIKADAYGLGGLRVADALASVVSEFAYFAVSEAREVGRPGLILGPPEGDPAEYRELNLRPAVANRAAARKFAGMHVAVKVDTGMQRFGCPPDDLDDLVARCEVEDFFSHAVTLEAIQRLAGVCRARLPAARGGDLPAGLSGGVVRRRAPWSGPVSWGGAGYSPAAIHPRDGGPGRLHGLPLVAGRHRPRRLQ